MELLIPFCVEKHFILWVLCVLFEASTLISNIKKTYLKICLFWLSGHNHAEKVELIPGADLPGTTQAYSSYMERVILVSCDLKNNWK